MKRAKTPSFIVELPLRTSTADESVLAKRLEAARQVYNACLGEALRTLKLARERKEWQRARKMPKGPERSERFKKTAQEVNFTERHIEALATICKNNAFVDLLGAHETQKLGERAFKAVADYAYGKHGRPRFKGRRGLHSVEGKAQSCITFDGTSVKYKGLQVPTIIDNKNEWLAKALEAKTKFCRILRRIVGGKERWFVQLIQEGLTPTRNLAHHEGVVGLDVGPSTVAVVSQDEAKLVRFCDTIEQPWKKVRRLQRAMDRSRRATNPNNYNKDGTVKRGKKMWIRSSRYRVLATKVAEVERRLARERKRAHGELTNKVLALGNVIKTEKLSYYSFQRTFGRSVKVRAPGMFISMLRRKAARAGGKLEEFPTRTTCLSQVCHGCGSLTKKPLSLRVHECACGVGPVQRDLYSAFLARCVREKKLDVSQAQRDWPDVESLLRRAASSFQKQPASGKGLCSFPGVKHLRAGRLSRLGRTGVEAADVVPACPGGP